MITVKLFFSKKKIKIKKTLSKTWTLAFSRCSSWTLMIQPAISMALGDRREMAGSDVGLETPLTSASGLSSFTLSLRLYRASAWGKNKAKTIRVRYSVKLENCFTTWHIRETLRTCLFSLILYRRCCRKCSCPGADIGDRSSRRNRDFWENRAGVSGSGAQEGWWLLQGSRAETLQYDTSDWRQAWGVFTTC